MNWLNYHHLMYFKTIATEGTISKASKKLLVGQPALSTQLKKLEDFFGYPLFERRNRKLFLTEAGKVALKYANQIQSLGAELQQVLQDKSFTVRPHLSIGALDSIPKNLMVGLIEKARKMRDCDITVIEGTAKELFKLLNSHQIDFFVSNHHVMPSENKSVYSKSIGKFPVSVYGSSKFNHVKKNFPKSLQGQPIILPTIHSKLRTDVELYLQTYDVQCNVVASTQDTAIQKLLGSDGVGLIAEPEFAVRQLVKEKKLRKIGKLLGVYEEFFLISNQRLIENKLVTEILSNYEMK